MKFFTAAVLLLASSLISYSQDNAQKIYDTERAFEKAVAEKGIKAGFIEFLSPLGVIFRPGPINGRESWSARPESQASLTWNPIKIEVSSNGALAYSIGNSIFRPKGKKDTDQFYGHYLSVWTRQPGGEYRAALDAGINHEKPAKPESDWKPGGAVAAEANEKRLFAGDSSISFYRLAENRGLKEAYKRHAADDIYLLRDGHLAVRRPRCRDRFSRLSKIVRSIRKAALIHRSRRSCLRLQHVLHDDKNGVETEKGNYIPGLEIEIGKMADRGRSFPAAARRQELVFQNTKRVGENSSRRF
jgi:ketosteroid isomerase-like protein